MLRLSRALTQAQNDRTAYWLAASAVTVVCALAYTRTLAPGVTWANSGLDSGDLITAAVTGGVPHPSGYPTYLLLAELFLLLPLPDPAVAVTLLSAAAATLTALTVYDTIWGWGQLGPQRLVAATLAALALGLSPLLWSQAVIAEVYCLNTLFAALLLRAALARTRGMLVSPVRVATTSLVAGIALGNHLTIVPMVLAWLVAASCADGKLRLRLLGRQIAWASAGTLVYLTLPLRAAAAPAVSWGGASQWDGFWWLVTGRLYAGLAFGLSAGDLAGRVTGVAALLVAQFGWAGLALGCYGLMFGYTRSRGAFWVTVVPAACAVIFAVGYNSVDSQVYVLPASLVFALWIGLGVSDLLGRSVFVGPRRGSLAAVMLAVALLWQAPFTARAVDASQDRRAITYARAVMDAAPPNALIFTSADRDTFPLWYYHFALGERPDLTVVVAPLLGFAWYRGSLHSVYPKLPIPASAPAGWEAALIGGRSASAPLCRTALDPTPHLTCAGGLVDRP
jgi:hypothetical protein